MTSPSWRACASGWPSSRWRFAEREALESSFRGFMLLRSEGVVRYDGYPKLPVDWPEREQAEFLLDHVVVAECNHAYARLYGVERAEDMVGAPMFRQHGPATGKRRSRASSTLFVPATGLRISKCSTWTAGGARYGLQHDHRRHWESPPHLRLGPAA